MTEKIGCVQHDCAECVARLAQPEQEPVGYEHHEYRPFGAPSEIRIHAILKSQFLLPDGSIAGDFQWLADQYATDKSTIKLKPLYTAPPQRPWVGLTDEERDAIEAATLDLHGVPKFFATAIEAKLRSKNT